MEEYDHKKVEEKWQNYWEENDLHKTPENPDPDNAEYVLDMFPYPSGSGLHVGHVEGYTGTDVYSRFCRMQGKDVLHPMGWDAFGLPAENYAIETGTYPRERTSEAIDNFTDQIKNLGLSYDWDREINTSTPEYYQWTQWLFSQLFEAGLAEKKPAAVNWCPGCQTVLANEQIIDGQCDRCDSEVTQKEMDQWFFNITDYADDLLDDLEGLDWPESTKESQRNWIGKKEGARFQFSLNEKARIVVLHGFQSGPGQHFHPWLKEALESEGYEVITPTLPDADDPDIEKQIAYVKENVKLTEDTILVGHSLGTIVAMKALEDLDKSVRKTVLIGAYADTEFKDGEPRSYEDTFDWEFDFDAIKESAGLIKLLKPEEDDAISDEQTNRVAKNLNVTPTEIPVTKPHARGEREEGVLSYIPPSLDVFTTRPDTLFGVTFMAIAPEHEVVQNCKSQIQNWDEVEDYIEQAKAKTDRERKEAKEKTGVKLEGVTAIHPATEEEIPVFVADYVLENYGTGAIMAVPAHDERDHEFAEKYDLSVTQVVAPEVEDEVNPPQTDKDFVPRKSVHAIVRHPYEEKILSLKWKEHDWQTLIVGGVEEGEDVVEAAKREVYEETGYKNISFVEECPLEIVSHYFAAHKDENRRAHTHTLVFELDDEKRDEVSGEEKAKHSVEWIEEEGISKLSPYSEKAFITRWLDQGVYAFAEEGVVIHSGEFSELTSQEAAEKITEKFGQSATTYRLRDWSVGRQRYWGCPIPVVYDPDGEPHAVPEKHLPWELPEDVEFEPTGEPPLAKSDELKERTEDIFGEGWTPETSTLDTFVDSSWYFLRFTDPHNQEEFAGKEALSTWCPVDMYVGGSEHAVMHLLYARFVTKALNDLGHVDFREPFQELRHPGLIMAEDGTKMSKSKGNVVNPNEVVDQVGADTLRMYELFAGPFSETVEWDTESIAGPRRFLERTHRLIKEADTADDLAKVPESDTLLHKTIKTVTEDLGEFKFNTAISSLMEMLNEFRDRDSVAPETMAVFVRLLAPFAPHLTEELWRDLGGEESVHLQSWPDFKEAELTEDSMDLVVQVDGTVRAEFTMPKNADESAIVEQAKSLDNVQRWLENSTVTRHIYVPGRLVNFVTDSDN